MDKLIVTGGSCLSGTVTVSGAKNASLPIMAATLLFPSKIKLENLPKLSDIVFFKQILESLGAKVSANEIDCSEINSTTAEYDLVRKMRASVLVLGPLLARFHKAKVSLPGGCAIGSRPVDIHIKALEQLGAKIEVKNGYIIAECDDLIGAPIELDFPSVGATENLLMASIYAKGKTIIRNFAKEPEVIDLIDFLNAQGAKIEIHQDRLEVLGVELEKKDVKSYKIIGDRIEAATFIIAAVMTKGEITVKGFEPNHIKSVLDVLKYIGAQIETKEDSVTVKKSKQLRGASVETLVHPGFPTDVQAQLMSLLGTIEGQSSIKETIFENRFMHVPELVRMGMNIKVDGNEAIINGVSDVTAAPVMCTDLRASAALVLSALVAKGDSHISRIYHLDRGYEGIEKKLHELGAKIKRVKS